MQNQGLFIANEVHSKRAWELAENLERWGATNVLLTNENPERLAIHFGDYFNRILVDAPCSGEGMFRKSRSARSDWSPSLVQSCALRQTNILEQAARLLSPGGRLVYSTCTFSPEENEQVLARFLGRHSDFELVTPFENITFASGRPDWVSEFATSLPDTPADLSRALRLWPHLEMGEGHFIAALERKNTTGSNMLPVARTPGLPENILRLYREFCSQYLQIPDDSPALVLTGDQLYLRPAVAPSLDRLRVLRPGLWLGTLRPGRFEPSHTLALAIRQEQARYTAALDPHQTRRYLHGETLTLPGPPGWILMTTESFPIGWGKRVATTIKNAYPKGLRWY
jgi:NOL1/NOP2/fmu family ribosome biogenesis protein